MHTRTVSITIPQSIPAEDLCDVFGEIDIKVQCAVSEIVSQYFARNHDKIARSGIVVTME